MNRPATRTLEASVIDHYNGGWYEETAVKALADHLIELGHDEVAALIMTLYRSGDLPRRRSYAEGSAIDCWQVAWFPMCLGWLESVLTFRRFGTMRQPRRGSTSN